MSVAAKMADFISPSRCWQNADNLCKKARRIKSRQLSCSKDEPWSTRRPSQPKQKHHHS